MRFKAQRFGPLGKSPDADFRLLRQRRVTASFKISLTTKASETTQETYIFVIRCVAIAKEG
jgi:hypothetical protein